jgi:parallel beta-helix repeat protein
LDDGRFEENSVAGNPEAGILLDHGNGNEFSHNRFSNNGDGIVVSGDANTVAGNWLSGPSECPEECGFDVDNAATTVTRNLAFRNGDLGIEAVAGVTDGGGNHASNGNLAQCTNVVC